MGMTELPSTAVDSLGTDLTTKPGSTDGGESWRLRAPIVNKIRTYLIALGQAVGLGDGSTPNSLEARANPPHLRAMPSAGLMPPISIVEHFVSPAATAPLVSHTANGGTAQDTAAPPGRIGLARLARGTSASGRAGYQWGGLATGFPLGSGTVRARADIRITQLSTGTQQFYFLSGLGDAIATYPTDGVFFYYIDTVNGGRWCCVTRANGVETSTDSGVTVVAGTWYALELEVSADGTQARFWVNGTLVATNTTNIPSGAGRETSAIPAVVFGLVGTTSVTADIDYCAFRFDPTVAL